MGALTWFIPLVIVTGGPSAYWRALSNQGAEDLGNISMLWTTHSARAVADALYYTFVAPWATWTVAVLIQTLAAIGIVWLARRDRRPLAALAAAFGPYLVFHLLFQETFTGRYALPLVVPTAYLAIAGLRLLPRQSGAVVAAAIVMFDAHAAGSSIAAYSRQKAPAFRLLDDMASAARRSGQQPVLAMDRRNQFDFRRPIVWADGAMPPAARRLPAPPQHEWLEAVKYWNEGGRAPVWFVVDPKRASIDLVRHGDPVRYRWPLAFPGLVSGARPGEMDWYAVDRPEWYVGEGWALTPEAAGVADADGRGLARGPIRAWMRADAGSLMIGGRNLEPALRSRLTVTLRGNGAPLTADDISPGPFLLFMAVPPRAREDRPDYVTVDLAASPPARIAVEQFDASGRRAIWGFGAGWHEPELNPRTGSRWRWLSERGELELIPRPMPLSLHIEGESPRRYFDRGSRLVIRWRDEVAFDRVLTDDFSLDVPLGRAADAATAASPDIITLETDQIYVPAERSRRSHDRRRLGLRIFRSEIRITPSAQATAACFQRAR
jgi:hypothetical protein